MRSSSKPHLLLLVIVAVHVASSSSAAAAAYSPAPLFDLFPLGSTAATACSGSIAECLVGEEFEMDSEVSRRTLLAAKRYISYAALSRGTVPCSRRGASYYNCRPGAQANPYSRGCSRITRCRR